MAQVYRGILIGNKKEYSNDTCCNGDEKGKIIVLTRSHFVELFWSHFPVIEKVFLFPGFEKTALT